MGKLRIRFIPSWKRNAFIIKYYNRWSIFIEVNLACKSVVANNTTIIVSNFMKQAKVSSQPSVRNERENVSVVIHWKQHKRLCTTMDLLVVRWFSPSLSFFHCITRESLNSNHKSNNVECRYIYKKSHNIQRARETKAAIWKKKCCIKKISISFENQKLTRKIWREIVKMVHELYMCNAVMVCWLDMSEQRERWSMPRAVWKHANFRISAHTQLESNSFFVEFTVGLAVCGSDDTVFFSLSSYLWQTMFISGFSFTRHSSSSLDTLINT